MINIKEIWGRKKKEKKNGESPITPEIERRINAEYKRALGEIEKEGLGNHVGRFRKILAGIGATSAFSLLLPEIARAQQLIPEISPQPDWFYIIGGLIVMLIGAILFFLRFHFNYPPPPPEPTAPPLPAGLEGIIAAILSTTAPSDCPHDVYEYIKTLQKFSNPESFRDQRSREEFVSTINVLRDVLNSIIQGPGRERIQMSPALEGYLSAINVRLEEAYGLLRQYREQLDDYRHALRRHNRETESRIWWWNFAATVALIGGLIAIIFGREAPRVGSYSSQVANNVSILTGATRKYEEELVKINQIRATRRLKESLAQRSALTELEKAELELLKAQEEKLKVSERLKALEEALNQAHAALVEALTEEEKIKAETEVTGLQEKLAEARTELAKADAQLEAAKMYYFQIEAKQLELQIKELERKLSQVSIMNEEEKMKLLEKFVEISERHLQVLGEIANLGSSQAKTRLIRLLLGNLDRIDKIMEKLTTTQS
jgi:DNA repair exonuclease SbcCD ATPase subunit